MRRVADMVKAVRASGGVKLSGFLNDRQQELATASLNRERWTSFVFGGGYEGAERMRLCVFEDEEDAGFEVSVLRILPQGPPAGLTHRDYLGALLGTGLVRECFGDILVEEEGAVVFVQRQLLGHVMEQLDSVGRQSVKLAEAADVQTPEAASGGLARTVSVASLRLDAVLAAMLPASRAKALQFIQSERVQVNHILATSPHHGIEVGDVISVRGNGKYRIQAVPGVGRKGRTRVKFVKY